MIEKAFDEKLAKDIEFGGKFGKIKTRQGFPVRIVCWDTKGPYPITGLIDYGEYELPTTYTNKGKSDYRTNVRTTLDLLIEVEGGEV